MTSLLILRRTTRAARGSRNERRASHASSHALRRAVFPALLLLAVLSPAAFAERRERLVEGWRPVHYEVAISFDRDLSEIARAEAKITVEVLRDGLRVVDLDFGEMSVDGVTVGGRAARYEHDGKRLNVALNDAARRGGRLVVAVAYHGKPKDGLILTKDKDGNPSATGDNWPDRLHHWVPSLNHPSAKATVSFMVTAPAKYWVVANGRVVSSSDSPDGTRTQRWSEKFPIPPYCMVVVVGEFAMALPAGLTRDPLRSPIQFYVPPSQRALAAKGFGAAVPSYQFFSRTVAPFPYEKLAHIVGATRFGGMENSTAIVYTSTLLDPRPDQPVSPRFGIQRRLVELVAHETAHQWFGDAVTPATWADLWLSEGFATYFAGLFVERYEGEAGFREYMTRKGEDYFRYAKTRRAPIHDRETENLNQLLNANNYQKGAWVLHMLRRRLGDAAFFRGVRAYYRAHLHGNATTEDLRRALEQSSGQPLRAFFARWVYGAGHPVYEANWSWRAAGARGSGGTLVLTLAQTQAEEFFGDPVTVEIATPRGARRVIVRPTGRETATIVPLPARPTDVRVDPQDAILNEIESAREARRAFEGRVNAGPKRERRYL
jgi:aminopeptidase N